METITLHTLGSRTMTRQDESPEDKLKRIFLERLENRLGVMEITPYRLAKRTGLSRESISRYIRGESLPSRDSLRKLALALAIPEDRLVPKDLIPYLPAAPKQFHARPKRIMRKEGDRQGEEHLDVYPMPGQCDAIRVCINQVVSLDQAASILKTLNPAEADALLQALKEAIARDPTPVGSRPRRARH